METKLAARSKVHETFKRAAKYYPTSNVSGAGTDVSVRVHSNLFNIGDLDREGFPQISEEIERVMFLRTAVEASTIKRGGYLKMMDTLQVYHLELRNPARDTFTVTFEVTRVE